MASKPPGDIPIDPGFARRLQDVYGEDRATRWLQGLPGLVTHLADAWGLALESPYSSLTYSWVAPGHDASGAPVALKLTVPSSHLATEAAALEAYAGEGAVRLLRADLDAGALLLERAVPGDPLLVLDDDSAATEAAIQVMQRLRRPPPAASSFPALRDWARAFERHRQRFGGTAGPLPRDLVAKAEDTFYNLLAQPTARVLLHGDLHHRNILRSQREGWLAIDPEGVIGEPEYEVAAFMRNPFPHLLAQPSRGRILRNRLAQLASELGFDRERLRAWSFAHAVLSAVWAIEDHGAGWEYSIEVARLLRT